jgi:hypothetical protein
MSSANRNRPKRRWRRRLAAAVVLVAALIAAGWWTMIRMPGESYRGPLPPADEALDALAAELRRDVDYLATTLGERNVSHCPQQLAQAADYLAAEFRRAGYEVDRQVYTVEGVACANLAAEIRGVSRPAEIVVVGAHYDSVVGTPGANDNASGVAAVLALARRLATSRPGRTLRFAAFANEEPPYFQTDQMGSRVYARRCRERNERIVAMLSLETIGCYSDEPGSQQYPPPFNLFYPSTGDFIAAVGNYRSATLVREVVEHFRRYEPFPCEGAAIPSLVAAVGFSDHWSFWQEGYPALMVTDTAMFRYPHYHEPSDTVDKVDFDRTARVVRGLGRAVAWLAEAE